jgi:hypothetical protein
MKKIVSTLFFYLLLSFTFGQDHQDYSLYHDKILLIEAFNSRASFDSSIIMYSDIFSQYSRVFAKDAYNACQIAALKKNKYFSDFFYACAKSGITKNELLSNGLIQSGFARDSIKLNALYLKGIQSHLNRIDTTLRREMIQRFETEQKIKGKEGYAAVCTDNFNRILELATQGRFPGEDLIGNIDRTESIILPTLCHYPYSYKIMEPYLIEAVKKGKLTPASLIYLYGFNQTRTSILYTADIPCDTLNFKLSYNMPYGAQSYDFAEVDRQRSLKKIYTMSVQKNLRSVMAKYGVDYQMGY